MFPVKSYKACRVEEIVVDKYGFPKLAIVSVTVEDGGK